MQIWYIALLLPAVAINTMLMRFFKKYFYVM